MAKARIAAIALTLLSATLVAQQPPKTSVTVQVTDVTGAGVPRAAIEVIASPETKLMTFKADESGKAEFELPLGDFDLHVKSQGFCPFRRFLEPLNEQNKVVTAKLQIDSCPGPCQLGCITVTEEAGNALDPVQVPRDLLKVIVTDPTGAVIQRANVVATSTLPDNLGGHWSGSSFTSTLGEVSLDLPKGTYDLSVTANGFKMWSMPIERRQNLNQVIRARMLLDLPSDHSHFAINVKDTAGVAIPAVKIEAIDPGWGKESLKRAVFATTDAEGEAALDLAPGHRVYMVQADSSDASGNSTRVLTIGHFECSDGPGWVQRCSLQIEMNDALGRPVKITATVGQLPCTLCIDVNEPAIPLEPDNLSQAISLEPVRNLILPAKPYRKRHS